MRVDQLIERIEREKSKHGQRRLLERAEHEALADARRGALADMNQTHASTPEGRQAYQRFRRVGRAMDLH